MDKMTPDWDAWARSLEQFSSDYEPRSGDDRLAVLERLWRRVSDLGMDPDELEADIKEAISDVRRQRRAKDDSPMSNPLRRKQ